jgi:hypothetical protein
MGANLPPATGTHTGEPLQYIVARMAQWAGDFDYALTQYAAFATAAQDVDAHAEREYDSTPEGIMREAARLRHQQITARIDEFKEFTRQAEIGELTYQPLIIATAHLRGAIWRLGLRWLQMRAYMFDLSWATELKARAQALLQRYGGIHGGTEGAGTWSLGGNPFVTVTLSDRCLIQADAHWASTNFPESADPFIRKFRRVLADLDMRNPDVHKGHEA